MPAVSPPQVLCHDMFPKFERLLLVFFVSQSLLMREKAEAEIEDRLTKGANMRMDDRCCFWTSAVQAKIWSRGA